MRKKNGLNRVLPWMIVAAMIVGIATFSSNDFTLNASDGDGDTTAAEQQAIAAQEPETVEITLPPVETEAVVVPPAPEPVQETVIEPEPAPAQESVSEPVQESVPEPEPEPVPAPEPVPEPVPEPIAEPVQERAAEPAPEPVQESAPEPGGEVDEAVTEAPAPAVTEAQNPAEPVFPAVETPKDEMTEESPAEENSGAENAVEEITAEVTPKFTGSVRINAGVSVPMAGEEIVLRAMVDNTNTDAYTLRWEKFNEERGAWESMGRTGDTLYLTATVGGAGSRYRVVLSAGEKDIDTATYTMPAVQAAESREADEQTEAGEVAETEETAEEKNGETAAEQTTDENTDEETDEAVDNETGTEPESDENTDGEVGEASTGNDVIDGETPEESEADEAPVGEEAETTDEAELPAEKETEAPELLPNPDRSVAILLEAKGAIHFGDDVVFRAILNGYENLKYILRWQQCDNGSDWYDLPGEHGEALTVKVTTANANSNWRICVDITEVIGE